MKRTTRFAGVVNGELTIVNQIVQVSFQDARSGQFISAADIQELGREVENWETVRPPTFRLAAAPQSEAEALDSIDEIEEVINGDDVITHRMWQHACAG